VSRPLAFASRSGSIADASFPFSLPTFPLLPLFPTSARSRRSESSSPPLGSATPSSSASTRASRPRLASTSSWSTSREEISCSTSSVSSSRLEGPSSTPPRSFSLSSTSTRTALSTGAFLPHFQETAADLASTFSAISSSTTSSSPSTVTSRSPITDCARRTCGSARRLRPSVEPPSSWRPR